MAATIYQLGINATSADKNKKAFNGQFTQGNLTPLNGVDGSILVKDIKFNAQMYSPNSLEVVLSVTGVNLEDYNDIRLSLYKSETTYVAQNYYVVEKKFKITSSAANQREYTLKAYSADYFLTIDKFCQAFTGKTLKDGIVVPTLQNSVSKNFNLFRTLAGEISNDTNATKDATDYLVINQQNFNEKSIIPYAVQYNESFYDFLMRMCNRDGEFLYFGTDNKLHIGLGKKAETTTGTTTDNTTDTATETTTETEFELTDSYTAEFIQTYNTEDTTNWVEPDYLGKLKNKDCDYLDDFNKPIGNENSNINSSCLVLAPEYLENINEANGQRGKYVEEDEYFTNFSAVANTFRSFCTKKTMSDAIVSTITSILDESLHIGKWVTGYNNDYKEKFNVVEDSSEANYLYADATRTNAIYKDIYNKLEEVKSNQVEVIASGENFPGLGTKVKFNNEIYVVHKLDVNFISEKNVHSQESDNKEDYSQQYRLLLVKCKKINKGQDGTQYIAYPLPLLDIRMRKASAQRAIVMDNFDPDRIGRVRVKFPWQKEDNQENWSPWIRVSTPMASKDAGMLFTPLVGDEVLVDFENENVESPYVSGAFYSDSHRPSVLAQSQTNGKVKSITSTNGHHIAFFDNGSAERFASNFLPIAKTIASFGVCDGDSFTGEDAKHFAGGFEISDYHGIYAIKGSTHNRSISISSPYGDVSIDAFQGITINAPLGDVKIVGKNVSIEARNNLTLESGTNIKNCFGNHLKNGKLKTLNDFGSSLVADSMLGYITGMVDLSFFRNYLEVVLRPIGGTLLIKSNRYLRLEAGDGKTVPNKNIDHTNYLKPIINMEQYSTLQYAKKEACGAFQDLLTYTEKLLDILSSYKSRYRDNRGRYFYEDAEVDFYNSDGSIKPINKLVSVKDVDGNEVIDYIKYMDECSYRDNIVLMRERLEECYKIKKRLLKSSYTPLTNLVNEIWDTVKREFKHEGNVPIIQIPVTQRELVYNYLRNAVLANKVLNESIRVDEINDHNFSADNIKSKVRLIEGGDDAPEGSFSDMWKDKLLDSAKKILDYSGFMELFDDKVWTSSDNGAILFSDEKKTFFKMSNDGTLKKGWNKDYSDEFIDLMTGIYG